MQRVYTVYNTLGANSPEGLEHAEENSFTIMRISGYVTFLVSCWYFSLSPHSAQAGVCKPGYYYNPIYFCIDINECDSSPCGPQAVCKNTPGSFKCSCHSGFKPSVGNSGFSGGAKCEDINECDSSPCGPQAVCKNTPGSFKCSCHSGFKPSVGNSGFSGGAKCEDVNECEDEGVCGRNATCYNSVGSYHCICHAGFHPEPGKTQNTCKEPPFNCPNAEKQENSILVECGLKHSETLKQSNTSDNGSCSILESARRLLGNVCQNFSAANDTQAITEFVNDLLDRKSRWANMEVTQRLNVAAAIMDLMENMAMAIALTLPSAGAKTISEDTFALEIQVAGGQNMSLDDLVRMHVRNNTMEIYWKSIIGAKHSEFAAVSLLVFNNMESILNSEIYGEGNEQAHKTERTIQLNSKVIAATISNKAASHELAEKVNFTLKLNQGKKANEKIECVYWKTTAVDSFWSSEGCIVFGSNQTHDDLSMMIMTSVGLTISLLCLVASIVVFVKCRSIQNSNTTVHKHLSVNLFLAQLLFLTGTHVRHKIICALVAGCLHYLFLTVFAWMFLDALQLFIACRHLTVKVFTRTHVIKQRFLYPSGYAVSALIVIISAAIHPSGYGSEKVCWLKLESGFRWSFQGPVCFVIVVNVVLFVWTLCLLRHHLSTRNVNVSKIKDTRTLTLKAAARLFIMGCTWIFGIFNVNESTSFLSYIFIVINTLQGVFIFLVYCVFSCQVRNEFRKWFTNAKAGSLTDFSNVPMNSHETNEI
ncbi:adhesion G protein-coupled receptor E1-like isoform X2 [Carcharodon carcharias]|uniref:adhesion G protein-coupled receptor E1-like isoform X2 n=1 Tax=Carcharodon carcharias TaxID=13397 RepID=UPI001B7D959C|nr:adhesion G protein-coupled receptor E1-like isoform X2 [Carcharodon carcharias]